jgi:hypothetical protein
MSTVREDQALYLGGEPGEQVGPWNPGRFTAPVLDQCPATSALLIS